MRLVGLKLQNWRGVSSREVAFKQGVTIIEGPNEIGKSTLVEALFTLISDLDSSSKQSVRAIQPAGQDVGSTVKAEIESGEYRFVYEKTFNKGKATSLEILQPAREQLTGREAHERVLEMLTETVDVDLWKALLVDQGEKVSPANLKDSKGLSNALDEAAGGSTAGQEDSALYAAAQVEVEKYFTKTGRPKFTELEAAAESAEADLEAAIAALKEVERDTRDLERLNADIEQRTNALPALKANLEGLEERKRASDKLKGELELKEQQLTNAEEKKASLEQARADRRELVARIDEDATALADAKVKLDPLKARVKQLEEKANESRAAIESARTERRVQKDVLELAQADVAYIGDNEKLVKATKLGKTLQTVTTDLRTALKSVGEIAINGDLLQSLRSAIHNLELVKSKRDFAATAVTVVAEKELQLNVDAKSVSMRAGEKAHRSVATELLIEVPDVASIKITPPSSVTDLDQELRDAEQAVSQILKHCEVDDLEAAITGLAKKQAAEQDVARLKARTVDLSGDLTPQELGQRIESLTTHCKTYVDARTSDTPLPENTVAAAQALDAARRALNSAETALETAQAQELASREELEAAATAYRDTQNDLTALDATLKEKQRRLESSRAKMADGDLDSEADAIAGTVSEVAKAVSDLQTGLAELSPDSVEALYDNAKAALERAQSDLGTFERNRAVLRDRLERAQADGRFEQCEAAGRTRDEARDTYEATSRRASAVRRLWDTLNRHRDEARQAYVRPLKEAIEQLGRIVFGSDFEVAVSDDWILETRTKDGKTLPYESLSVGAKEQLGILTRLAAAQIVSRQGGVPLIIDDALGFSDPGRLESMGAAISAAGKHCQIIILTCSPGRFVNVGNATLVSI